MDGDTMKRLMKPDGLKLHLLRISKELDMGMITQKCKLSRKTIFRVEKGEEVSTLTAQKMANAYQVNLFEYFELIEK
jgi:predicted transcriptional regulator